MLKALLCAVVAAVGLSTSAMAEATWTGRVVEVKDGDTLAISTGERTIDVRLAGIDAPENGQPGGDEARQALLAMLTAPAVIVEERDVDRYGRVVAHVAADGTDLSEEMVRQGFAWHYKRYSDDTRLAALEVRARADHLGLWSVPNPTAPWDYRHGTQPNEVLAAAAAAAAGKPFTSPQATPVKFTCGGKRRCGDMDSCEEAYFYLNQCGVHRLDGDGDGVPCEKIC